MDNQPKKQLSKEMENTKDNNVGGAQVNTPNPDDQNNTHYAGTATKVDKVHPSKDGYQIAVEDTMIGYNGDDSQMDMDLGDKDKLRSGSTSPSLVWRACFVSGVTRVTGCYIKNKRRLHTENAVLIVTPPPKVLQVLQGLHLFHVTDVTISSGITTAIEGQVKTQIKKILSLSLYRIT
jgi:hypothetical protein